MTFKLICRYLVLKYYDNPRFMSKETLGIANQYVNYYHFHNLQILLGWKLCLRHTISSVQLVSY